MSSKEQCVQCGTSKERSQCFSLNNKYFCSKPCLNIERQKRIKELEDVEKQTRKIMGNGCSFLSGGGGVF